MFRKSLSLIALGVLLSACSAAAANMTTAQQVAPEPALHAAPAYVAPALHAETSYDGAAMSCDVRSRRTSNGLLIQARLFADRDVDAQYDLRIVKSGGGNSSEINQSGEVSLAAGSSATLGENEISVERGSRVRAYLTIRDARGEICQCSFRL